MDKAIAARYLVSYLKLGFSPIPVQGKVANYHWKDYQFSFKDFIKPGVNIGLRAGLLPTGDYLAFIDLDSKELLAPFYEAHPNLMCAPLVSTGKGWHIYTTWKTQPRTRHLAGMDIIANGYVVAPPSIHPNGHVYKFIVPLRGLPPTYNPEEVLGKMIGKNKQTISRYETIYLSSNLKLQDAVRTKRIDIESGSQIASIKDAGRLSENSSLPLKSFSNHTRMTACVQEVNVDEKYTPVGVPLGQRHNTLIRLLGALHTACFTEEEAAARALAWGQKCLPPLSREEVIRTVKTCYEKWDLFA